eukprot:1087545-Prorocentrum_minimum.AAC.1
MRDRATTAFCPPLSCFIVLASPVSNTSTRSTRFVSAKTAKGARQASSLVQPNSRACRCWHAYYTRRRDSDFRTGKVDRAGKRFLPAPKETRTCTAWYFSTERSRLALSGTVPSGTGWSLFCDDARRTRVSQNSDELGVALANNKRRLCGGGGRNHFFGRHGGGTGAEFPFGDAAPALASGFACITQSCAQLTHMPPLLRTRAPAVPKIGGDAAWGRRAVGGEA